MECQSYHYKNHGLSNYFCFRCRFIMVFIITFVVSEGVRFKFGVLSYLAILGVHASADAVDLLVDLGTVVVTLLTSTCHSGGHTGRMPGTNTGNLAQTLVGLAGQFLGVPTRGDTLESLTLGDTNAIDHLILAKHVADLDGLLEMLTHPLDLILNGATVQLDLHDVRLLLALLDQTDLRKGKWKLVIKLT